jgi:hypothetical protein
MLVDLDELVLRCRDERARAYIREAVACYKAGAYRSAIVSTWIAVAFDIVDKVHELSIAGDKAAAALVAEIEHITNAQDLPRALAFERKLLAEARDKFELISPQEYLDLDRLQQDRHRCAHPSRMSLTEVFSPTAELARVHLRTAVQCLLQHEPAQGKAALDGLVRDISSSYFPDKLEGARRFLDKSALKRARPSLVRNVLIVLVKTYLDNDTDYKVRRSTERAMACMLEMHRVVFVDVLGKELTRIYRALTTEAQLVMGVRLLSVNGAFPDALEDDQIARLQQFASRLSADELDWLDLIADIPQLRTAAEERAQRITAEELQPGRFLYLPNLARAKIMRMYTKVKHYDSANAWGKIVASYADEFLPNEVREVLIAAAENPEIKDSFQISKVINALRTKNEQLPTEFEELVAAVQAKPKRDDDFDDDIPF